MKKAFRYILPTIGLFSILLFCVTATAGIAYTDLDHSSIRDGVYAIFGSFLGEDLNFISTGIGEKKAVSKNIIEPGTLLLFGFGIIGLVFIGKLNFYK